MMDLTALEQQRQTLDLQVERLRESLKYWQTWDAEYDGLKEEVLDLKGEADEAELTRVSNSYGGDLVNEKEIREICGLNKAPVRNHQQIVNLISRRQDYVQRNIGNLQKQLSSSEQNLDELSSEGTISASGSAGLPITEINEELDDEGNVIQTTLSQPEKHNSRLFDSLRKAGLTDTYIPNANSQDVDQPSTTRGTTVETIAGAAQQATAVEETSDHAAISDSEHSDLRSRRLPVRKKSVSFSIDTKPAQELPRSESQDGRKSVSFAPKVAVAPAAPEPDPRSVSFSPTIEEIPAELERTVSFSEKVENIPAEPERVVSFAPQVEEIPAEISPYIHGDNEVTMDLTASFKPGEKVFELNNEEKLVGKHTIVPGHESPEDARLRREMLQYNMNEVANVVAELDLVEGDEGDEVDERDDISEYTTSEYMDEDTPYTSGHSDDEDEEEDQFGRTTKRVISEDYAKQMEALQHRVIGNLGPNPNDEDIKDVDGEFDPGDVKRLVIREKSSSVSENSESEKKSNAKKRVSFAEELVVAEPDSPPLKAQKVLQLKEAPQIPTETIVERSEPFVDSGIMPAMKASRFKKARTASSSSDIAEQQVNAAEAAMRSQADDADYDSDGISSGPPGEPLASSIVERPAAVKPSAPPNEIDEDPELQRRELTAEYYRRRNDIIKQQGGFNVSEEADAEGNELGELMEERDGKLKKVSRFKAARMKQ